MPESAASTSLRGDPAGLVILAGMLLPGAVVGVFAAARRLRSTGR